MKKIVIILTAMLSFNFIYAQQTVVSNDSTVVAKYYAGTLGIGRFDTDGNNHWNSTTRLGVDVVFNLNKNFFIDAAAVYDLKEESKTIGLYFAGYHSGKLTVLGGFIQSLWGTKYTPYALSNPSLARFDAQGLAPGAGKGVKVYYSNFGVSIIDRGSLETQMTYKLGNVTAGIMAGKNLKGFALRRESKNFDIFGIWKEDGENQEFGLNTFWTFNSEKGYCTLTDFTMKNSKVTFAEVGVGKIFKMDKFSGLIFVDTVYLPGDQIRFGMGMLFGL